MVGTQYAKLQYLHNSITKCRTLSCSCGAVSGYIEGDFIFRSIRGLELYKVRHNCVPVPLTYWLAIVIQDQV